MIIVPPYLSIIRGGVTGPGRGGYNPYFDYYSRYGHYVFNSSDAAFNQGYEDGIEDRYATIARIVRAFNPETSHYYQEAGYGNFGEPYRSGFLRGYGDGYRS